VQCNVRGRDVEGFVAEAQAKIDPLVSYPLSIGWGGQFEHLETASGSDYSAPKKKARKPLTEGQVAARIHELTRTLHPQAAHVELPTARMISHAEEPGAVGGGAAIAGRKAPKKATAPKRGRKARKRG